MRASSTWRRSTTQRQRPKRSPEWPDSIGGVQGTEIITEPIEQRRVFYGNLCSADSWRYADSWKIGATVTAEFELAR